METSGGVLSTVNLDMVVQRRDGPRLLRDDDYEGKKESDGLSNKPFLIWLLTTQPYLKYVATLPCNLSVTACFLTLMFHKVVRQQMEGVVEFLITSLLQIYNKIF